MKSLKPRSTGQHTPVRWRTGLADALFSATQQRVLALVYGSVASHSDTAHSDIDLLLVSDALTLEQVYTVLTPVEQQLGRRVSPTLYGVAEFRRSRTSNKPFLTKVLVGETIRLTEDRDDLLTAG